MRTDPYLISGRVHAFLMLHQHFTSHLISNQAREKEEVAGSSLANGHQDEKKVLE